MRVEQFGNTDVQRWHLRQAARQVEAQFIHQLLRAMRRTIPSNGRGYSSQMYTDMMDEAMARQIALTDRFGIGRLLFEKLERYISATEVIQGEQTHEDNKL